MPHDLVIRNARLLARPDETVQIGISGGRIAAIGSEPLAGATVLEAGGNLVCESFVDAHLHLCKVYTAAMAGEAAARAYTAGSMGGAMTGIELAAAVKARYHESWIYDNARRALLDGLRHGVTHVQAFADTDTSARLEGVKALLRLKRELQGIVDVRVVAFPQDGLLRDPGAEGYVEQAMALGADVVGGIPWIEYTDAEAQEHVDGMLRLAQRLDRRVAMLVDDAGDPGLRTTAMLAEGALRYGLTGRITACHARALAHYPEPTLKRLIGLARRAGMVFVANPHTGPVHLPVAELLAAGLPVALGQDDIADAYYPFGQHSMLEVAFLAAHRLGVTSPKQMETLLAMITGHAARAIGLDDYGLRPGTAAHLVVLQGGDAHAVLSTHLPPRHVISHGALVAESTLTTRWHRPGLQG